MLDACRFEFTLSFLDRQGLSTKTLFERSVFEEVPIFTSLDTRVINKGRYNFREYDIASRFRITLIQKKISIKI